jgi:primosomal protein N''
LPELPSTLQELRSELLICDEDKQGSPMIYNWMSPRLVETVNQIIRKAETFSTRKSKERCMKRCAQYKEEIMMKAWHPSRVEKLLHMGYDVEDM